MEDILSFAHQVFDAQPFSQFIGARLTNVGPGSAELSLTISDNLKQQHGFVHGGVLRAIWQTMPLPLPAGLHWAAMP
ncbi:hypothetical protein GCM10011491_39210 [Brucella endophytica]|uniref:PaaI family thioesterase n=1 Tax=Brucella endophytica TaxID=1963359 RepID=A0A916SPT0_9HYPH|nr:hypothetical protein [Brucella endophytica]GGB07263.1 hypothetical protein GCM10011491_39210 [Brucella endophytica]